MDWVPIRKPLNSLGVTPNLVDYDKVCGDFSWASVRREFEGLPRGGGFNMAHEAVDRHANGPLRNHLAIRWMAKDGRVVDFTYGDLQRETNRFANLLRELGIGKGDRVFALAGRVPELYITALGTLKNGSVFCPLFSAFGPEPVRQRLSRGDAKVLVTTERLYRKNVEPSRPDLPLLEHVLLLDAGEDLGEGIWSFRNYMAKASSNFNIPPTSGEDMALLHFTSGTTGLPKGAIHVHEAALMHYMTGKYALDLHPGDIFWCTADPGWITGTSYGIIAPLLHGVTNLIDEAEFDAERWYKILEEQQVNVWYTAPTAIRMLMRQPIEPRKQYNLGRLRFVASVGEPLNPAAVVWGQQALGLPIHDNWWQTETGGIMISNFAVMEIRPGSMGRPLPGVEAAVVRRVNEQAVEQIREPNVEGELALRPGWPSMFRGYLHDEERYRKCFVGGWYLT
ncbi:MAG: AMP-binding protein, partial [Acidobacteria bacterium]|nr:AMP-binding protein [Acidobacteriota bacterium]